jgi:hypothetical protein
MIRCGKRIGSRKSRGSGRRRRCGKRIGSRNRKGSRKRMRNFERRGSNGCISVDGECSCSASFSVFIFSF